MRLQGRLVSDVPLCTFLSGGVDSSAITAIAAKEYERSGKGQLHTYSIDYEDNDKYFKANAFQPNSDAPFIHLMTETFQTIHHRCVISNEQLAQYLTEAVLVRDLPGMADIDSSLLWFCREIKQDFVVGLSGNVQMKYLVVIRGFIERMIYNRVHFRGCALQKRVNNC